MARARSAIILATTLLVTACGGSAASGAELAPVIQREGVAFDIASIPTEMLDDLAGHRVVVIGETHLIVEQRELTIALVTALHARGFRQLLLEWPHMADVVLDDYVMDRGRFSGWEPPQWLLGDVITAVRDLNRSLPQDERISVRAIDVNLDEYGGASDFVSVLWTVRGELPDARIIDAFLHADYGSVDDQRTAIERLAGDLEDRRDELVESWGADWHATLTEMVEVEAESIEIRARQEDDYDGSVRQREEVMKRLVDVRLCDSAAGAVVNVGGNHAQRKRLKGTSQEWLGDYLVHHSGVVAGGVVVVVVVPAQVTSVAGRIDFALAGESPENELFRLMSETFPGRAVYLPLDDPLFSSRDIAMNYEGAIYTARPKEHYDAVVLLPDGRRVPLP